MQGLYFSKMLRAYKAKHDSGIYRLKEYEELWQINVLCDSPGFSSEKKIGHKGY